MVDQRYREIVSAVDAEFERNRGLHGARIRCRAGCSDCCYHVFLVTPYEADRVAEAVGRLSADAREQMVLRARDYVEHRLKRGDREPCPALVDNRCSIYDSRPLICHKFGMPIYNPDKPDRILACELNFRSGEEIRDPDLIQIQTELHQAWKQWQADESASRAPRERMPMTIAEAILMTGHHLR